ncbi:MAG: acylphosphatase [Planctomycetes bacterium]|nr:acylphosphatase [Planctomycetota bacterium]
MPEQDKQRLCVYFSGRVQGVGFRFTTIHVARGYDITGFVRNLSDGRVELVAEGARCELQGLLAGLQQRMGRYINETDSNWLPATGEFSAFDIRY